MKLLRIFHPDFTFFLLFLVILAFVFRSLLLNFSTDLPDWRDYALVIWIIYENIQHIISLDFSNFFNSNAFYPNPYTLLFADTFLPQSIIVLPFFAVSKNLILSFNLVFILTFILNYLSNFIFWKLLFKKDYLAFSGAIFVVFSPFFHLELSHFQMMSYWPFFFSLYFLFQPTDQRRYLNSILAGIFLSLQFLAGVYLSIYLLTTIMIFYLIKFFDKKYLKKTLISVFVVLITFFLICGVFIKGYFDMKSYYHIQRDLKEYVVYSASLSDYIFTSSINSLLYNSKILDKWNSFDKNGWGGHASFPGIGLFFLGALGIFIFTKDKKTISLILKLDKQKAFFLLITLTGFVFSLGPRLNFNGTYAHIPLPFTVALKLIPIFESVRVSARWYFLFIFGLTFFALIGLQKYSQNKHKNLVLIGCFLIFVLELIPFNLKTESQNYIDGRSQILKKLCADKKQVVLELPVTHLDADINIADGLSYITKTQLASTYHKCYLVNGYSGYDLPENLDLANKLNQAIDNNDSVQFLSELRRRNINIVKFNPNHFIPLRQPNLDKFLQSLDKTNELRKIDTTIYSINAN